MRNPLVTFRAAPARKERWKAALDSEGKTLTEIVTAALDRFAARVEKKEAAE